MALSKEQLLKKKRSGETVPFSLPSGDEVLLLRPSAKHYRQWRASLRNDKSEFDQARIVRGDELLVSQILVNPDGSQMFSESEVLSDAMDLDSPDMVALIEKVYVLFGLRKEEGLEKK